MFAHGGVKDAGRMDMGIGGSCAVAMSVQWALVVDCVLLAGSFGMWEDWRSSSDGGPLLLYPEAAPLKRLAFSSSCSLSALRHQPYGTSLSTQASRHGPQYAKVKDGNVDLL